MNLGGEAGEGPQQLGEAQVVEAGEPLGVVAAERGHAGHEGVRDELVHRLHALGHRSRPGPAAAARPPPAARRRPRPPGGAPQGSLDAEPSTRLRRLGARGPRRRPRPSPPPLCAPTAAHVPPMRRTRRPAPGDPSDRRASVTARPEPPC